MLHDSGSPVPLGQKRKRPRKNAKTISIEKAVPASSPLKRYYIKRVPPEHWDSKDNRRKYLDFVKQQVGNSYDSFYSVTRAVILNTGGSLLFGPSSSPFVDLLRQVADYFIATEGVQRL